MTQNTNQDRRLLLNSAVALGLSGSCLASSNAIAQSAGPPDRYGIRGRQAPELDIDYWIDGNGKPAKFSVNAARGQWVFLKCFQNWCPGCHSSGFPTLKAFTDAFHGHPKVAIAAIQTVFEGFNSNSQDSVRELQQRYELPIIMGHDPGNPDAANGDHRPQTMIRYRTGGTPWLILIDPDGSVVFNDFHADRQKLINYIKEQVA